MMKRMVDNIAKSPAEPKFRKVRLTNAKVADGLVHVPGVRQFMGAIGWELVEDEFMQLPDAADAAAQVAAVDTLTNAFAAAKQAERVAELDAIKAAMAKDRANVAARGPAKASVAKKLPSGPGGMKTSGQLQEEADAEDRANAH